MALVWAKHGRSNQQLNPGFEATKDTVSMAEGTFDHDAGTPDYSVRFSEDVGAGSLDVAKPHPGDRTS